MKQKKRQPLLSLRKGFKLRNLILARLLPPPPPGRPLQADPWRGGPDDAWARRYREVEWEIVRCLHEREEEEPAREQVEEIIEEITEEARAHLAAAFDFRTRELDPEKRLYIARELNRRFPLPASPTPEHDQCVAIRSTRRIKDFLCKNGLAPGEADQLIAEALGKTAGTLRQTLQRAK
jgi:hypothetical protein